MVLSYSYIIFINCDLMTFCLKNIKNILFRKKIKILKKTVFINKSNGNENIWRY